LAVRLFVQAEDGIRGRNVTGVQTCALPIWAQELIPTLYRSTAQGAMIAATRVVAAVVALWTPMLLRASPNLLFWFVAACIAGAALVGLLWIRRFPRVADEEDEARDAADLAAAQSTAPLSTETPSAETPSAETSPTPGPSADPAS